MWQQLSVTELDPRSITFRNGDALRQPFLWTACVLLAGCETFVLPMGEFRTDLAQEPFVQQPLASAWISVPDAEMVLARLVGPYAEQRILLTNRTALRGDNVVMLRAHGADLATNGRFQPVKYLASLDTDLFPFGEIADLSFFSRTDSLGTLNWAEWSNNAGLTCVLALRRLDGATRIVPAGRSAMDMILRNCIHGTADEALIAAEPTQAGFAAKTKRPGDAPEMLSPLAGPRP